MPRSFAQTTQAPCPECSQPVDLEIWLIVDLAERPDLAARIREGSLHAAPCPHCGHVGGVDAPLLIHDPERRRVLFSPAQGTTPEQDREQAQGLMGLLAETFLHPRPDYLTQASAVPRQVLPDVLDSDDPQAALEEIRGQALRAMLEQADSDPEARAALEELQRQMEENPLLRAIQALTEARSSAEVLAAVQAHPILLGDEADQMLRQSIESARQMGQEGMARHVEERYQTLRQIRERGIDPEQLSAVAALAEAIPPELRAIMDELGPVSSEAELEEKLRQRPELRERLEALQQEAAPQPREAYLRYSSPCRPWRLAARGRPPAPRGCLLRRPLAPHLPDL